jgi:hypothetical protein
MSSMAGTSRPANSMHVVIDICREVKVDDVGYVGDIEAASRHICRDEHSDRLLPELPQSSLSIILGEVTVDWRRADLTFVPKFVLQPIRRPFRVDLVQVKSRHRV